MTIDFSSADDADDADFLSKFTLLCHSERPSLSSRAKRSVAKDLEYIHFRLRYVPEILQPPSFRALNSPHLARKDI